MLLISKYLSTQMEYEGSLSITEEPKCDKNIVHDVSKLRLLMWFGNAIKHALMFVSNSNCYFTLYIISTKHDIMLLYHLHISNLR